MVRRMVLLLFWAETTPTGPESGVKERVWGAKEFGGGMFHVREFVGPNEDRIAWAFAIQRMDSLDVEELFFLVEKLLDPFWASVA
jgi:hypothetical protein